MVKGIEKRVIALFSGGLDSILAIRLMERAGFEVIPLFIYTPFLSKKMPLEIREDFKRYGESFKDRVIIHETGDDYLELVEKPKYGYGKNLNPCIDCKIFFLKIAKSYMENLGARYVVTGEVLGQRGMSQRKDAILKIEKESGLRGKIVRPLSLSSFPKTELEEKGILDASLFPSIKGRSRALQIELAKRLGIENYPQPSGGCLLTDPGFSKRVRVLIREHLFETGYIHAVKFGRLVLEDGIYVVARNDIENKKLLSLSSKYQINLFIPIFKGPVVAILKGDYEKAKMLSCRYTRHCPFNI